MGKGPGYVGKPVDYSGSFHLISGLSSGYIFLRLGVIFLQLGEHSPYGVPDTILENFRKNSGEAERTASAKFPFPVLSLEQVLIF